MAIPDEPGPLRTCTYNCDEAESRDSGFYGVYSNRATTSSTYSDATTDSWYFLNNSTSCITPGTAVRLTDPGHIIPVAQWDDVERVDAMRFQRIAPRQTAAEARIAQEAALDRAQAGIERNSAFSRQNMDRAIAQMAGLSRMEVGVTPQREARTAAQQQAVLTQRDLERAVELMSGVRSVDRGVQQNPPGSPRSEYEQRLQAEQQLQRPVSDRELGALWAEAQNADPACDTYRYRIPELEEFPVQPGPPPDPTYSEAYLAQEKKREEAEEKAQELLSHMIGKEQIEVYKRTDNLFVRGKKYSYIIPKDGFILQLKKDKVIQLCVHLEGKHAMPPTDNVIAMKLSIENEEKEVLKLANNWGERDRETYALPACAGMV